MDARKLIDPELIPMAEMIPYNEITRDNLAESRAVNAENRAGMEMPPTSVSVNRRVIPTKDGETALHIYQPENAPEGNPALLWFHGGGYIVGNSEDFQALMIADICRCTVISVEYRLAPEHPFPAGPEDGYAALEWVYQNTDELEINPDRIAIGGSSAGAGMAAGVALMNRDRKGLPLVFQYLLYPMLDNLHNTASGNDENHAIWNRVTSLNAWEMYLNGTPGKEASPYASASRAEDLSGLPPTYIVVGSQDLFRDEDIEYAQRLMMADVATQLEVFPGVFHGAEAFFPDTKISKRMRESYYQALKVGLMESG